MLPRTLQKSLQRSLQRSTYTRASCDVCVGRCSAQAQPQSHPFSTSARRTGALSQGAPSTRSAYRRSKGRALTPEEARKYQDAQDRVRETHNNERYVQLQAAHASGQFGSTPDEVTEFMAAFAELCKVTKTRVNASTCEAFRQLVDAACMSEQDLVFLAILLLRHKGVKDDQYWGRRLMEISAAAGNTEASIRLVNAALIQARSTPGVLRQASVSTERGRLQKMAREGTHSRAMVLEGKVAYHLGDTDTAIKWWWQAVDGAVAKSQHEILNRAAGIRPGVDISTIDQDDLSSPWIELIEAHYDRSLKGRDEWDQCETAIQIGIQQDDPTAFYYAATYYKKRDESGQHLVTGDWLYHMTKAAASGVPKAACELATFYHESGWKYIEDEPPDHVKPTPFDSYPASNAAGESVWDRVRQLFSPRKVEKGAAMEDIFQTAAWPPTPQQRHDLAALWLNIAIGKQYAPAYLQAAKMCLEKTLWAGAQAPEEALNLDPKRYLYASKSDEADAHFSGNVKTYEVSEDAEDPPNPAYNPRLAEKYLHEVVLARMAVSWREHTLKDEAKRIKESQVEWEDLEFEDLLEKGGPILKFCENPDVYDMWAKDSPAMFKEALEIGQKMGWKLLDDDKSATWPQWMHDL